LAGEPGPLAQTRRTCPLKTLQTVRTNYIDLEELEVYGLKPENAAGVSVYDFVATTRAGAKGASGKVPGTRRGQERGSHATIGRAAWPWAIAEKLREV